MPAYIVHLSVSAEEFRTAVDALSGVRWVRELPPGRVVVVAEPGILPTMRALPGVMAIREDRPEKLTSFG